MIDMIDKVFVDSENPCSLGYLGSVLAPSNRRLSHRQVRLRLRCICRLRVSEGDSPDRSARFLWISPTVLSKQIGINNLMFHFGSHGASVKPDV